MKRIIIRSAAMVWLLACSMFAQAQFLIKKDASLHDAVQKVLLALPGQLKTITGTLISDNPQSREYESKVQFPGSLSTSVVQYASVDNKKTIAAWQAVVMEEEDFKAAGKKFRWLYNQLKAGAYQCSGKIIRFKGKYEEPTEALTFTTVVLGQEEGKGQERIELSMQYEVTNWVIRIAMYNEDTETLSLIKNGPAE